MRRLTFQHQHLIPQLPLSNFWKNKKYWKQSPSQTWQRTFCVCKNHRPSSSSSSAAAAAAAAAASSMPSSFNGSGLFFLCFLGFVRRDHVRKDYSKELATLSCLLSTLPHFSDLSRTTSGWHGWAIRKTRPEFYICRFAGSPRTGGAAQDVHVAPGYGVRTMEADLQPLNHGLNSAWRLA